MDNNPINLKDKIMTKIKDGHVGLKSKYAFLAEKVGSGGILLLCIILAGLFFGIISFVLRNSGNIAYLGFGGRGFFAFLESFPYFLVIILILLVVLIGFLIKRFGIAYKQPFGRIAILLVAGIIVLGGVIDLARIIERMERHRFDPGIPGQFVRPLFQHGDPCQHRGVAGLISEASEQFIIVQSPCGLKKVDISNLERMPIGNLNTGSFIVSIGKESGDIFFARMIRIIERGELPMIRHEVNERFGPPDEVFPRPENFR